MSPQYDRSRTDTVTRPLTRALRALRLVAVPLVLTTGLTGCLSYSHPGEGYQPETVGERFPIRVNRAMARLDLEVEDGRLSQDNRQRVAEFARDYRTVAGGPLIVARPQGGSGHVAAAAQVAAIQKELRGAGIPQRDIAYRVYQAGGAEAAPVILTYERYEAVAPACGRWERNAAVTYDNQPYPNFGCATQTNLAAMVANPRDLVEPRAITPADQERRGVVIDAWRKGETTQTERTQEESGTVSEQKQSGG